MVEMVCSVVGFQHLFVSGFRNLRMFFDVEVPVEQFYKAVKVVEH